MEDGWTFANDMNLQKLSEAIIKFEISKHGHEPLDYRKDEKYLD